MNHKKVECSIVYGNEEDIGWLVGILQDHGIEVFSEVKSREDAKAVILPVEGE